MTNALNPGQFQKLEQPEPTAGLQQIDPICSKCGVTQILSNAAQLADGQSPGINPICAKCWVAAMHKS